MFCFVLGPQIYFSDLKDFEQLGIEHTVEIDYSWNWCHRPRVYSNVSTETSSDSPTSSLFGGKSRSEKDDINFMNSSECVESFSVRCVDSSIRLFCTIFVEQSHAHKLQVLKHFITITQKLQSSNANSSAQVTTNIAGVMLGLAQELTIQKKELGDEAILDAFLEVNKQLMSCANPEVRRAAGESLGMSVCLSVFIYSHMYPTAHSYMIC